MKNYHIKEARDRAGIGIQEMAEKLGLSTRTYSNRENGHTKFTDTEKMKVAEIFGWNLDEINRYLYDGKLPVGE